MGKKRKNPSFSNEIDYDGEDDDKGYDVRLVRRLKRRCVVNKDTNLNSVGKSSFNEGKCSKTSKKTEANCVKLEVDDDNDEDFVDADYKKYLDGLSSVLTGDDNATFGNGNTESMSLHTDALNDDVGTRNLEGNDNATDGNSEEATDAYYRSYLNILGLEDENADFVDRSFDVNASGDELVGNKFVNNDACGANNLNMNDRNSECMDGVAVETDTNTIENGTFSNLPEDSDRVDVPGGSLQTQSANDNENDDLDDIDPEYEFYLKNMMASDGNDTSSNSFEDIGGDVGDSGYDDFLKNAREDENGTSNNFSDGGSFQPWSGNNDTSQTDHLDNDDPDYEFFLSNLRKDGASFVLEIPAVDGISHIIKYEVDDGSRVENPETSRSSQEGSFERDLFDESYDKFIKALKNERGLVVYMPGNGQKVVYDEDVVESSSDSDCVVLETNPISEAHHEILSDDEEGGGIRHDTKNDCWFRQKVMEKLREPFDRQEYERLLHEVRVHKPVTEDRDMRNGRSRICLVNTMGRSLLDVHKDLKRSILSAGSNKAKILNILRGFFYWLQNTPHDVFKPWEDKLCLQVLPPEGASGRRVKKENIC